MAEMGGFIILLKTPKAPLSQALDC